jgi:hypothetical protein
MVYNPLCRQPLKGLPLQCLLLSAFALSVLGRHSWFGLNFVVFNSDPVLICCIKCCYLVVFDNGWRIFGRNRIFGIGNAAEYSVSAKVVNPGFGRSLDSIIRLLTNCWLTDEEENVRYFYCLSGTWMAHYARWRRTGVPDDRTKYLINYGVGLVVERRTHFKITYS